MPPYIQSRPEGVYVAVKAQPRSSKNAIGEAVANELKVKITAPPVDSAANEALIEFFVRTLGCSRGAVQIVRGKTSRHKLILITGVPPEEIARLLKPANS